MKAFAFILGSIVLATSNLTAQSTISPSRKYAYGANTGWINFRHDQPVSPAGIIVSEYILTGFAYGANFGWLHFGDGTPADSIRYSNTAAADCGVNHDGAGNLSGYAYGANIGWVNFGWTAGTNDPNRPRIDLFSGVFSGFAYSANTGWIALGNDNLLTTSILCPDADGDAMADAWENEYFGNTTTAGIGTDADGDGQSDAAEYTAGTDPERNASFLRIISHGYNDTFTKVDITFGATGPTRLYRIETSTNLTGPWGDSGLATFAADPGTTTNRTFSVPGAAARFFRAVALRPLP